MTGHYDLVVIGAGPAGLAAATRAAASGLAVMVLDEQPAAGGQIWRSVERVADTTTGEILGADYRAGARRVAEFKRSGARYETGVRVWQIEPGWTIFASRGEDAFSLKADRVLIATGAQERPQPFPGWTIPGVMTVGAAQILLKSSGEIPDVPVWVAGSGPLPLLYIAQLLRAGGKVDGWLVTTPRGDIQRALPHMASALSGWQDLKKGLTWMRELKKAGVFIEKAVTTLRAEAGTDGSLSHLVYGRSNGQTTRVPADLLLVHEGIVPSIHMTLALDCAHTWHAGQHCLVPSVDEWARTSSPGIYVAGDGAGIGGASAAWTRGELAAIGIAMDAGRLSAAEGAVSAKPLRERLQVELSTRGLLDALYPPRAEVSSPDDDTIVCRCEELTAGQIRAAARSGGPLPDRIKSLTRAGMGPCQGRQCGYTVSHLISEVHKVPVSEVGFYRVRPPLKPLSLGELASLDSRSSTDSSDQDNSRGTP